MGKHDATDCLWLVKRHCKPILCPRLVVEGHYEAQEVFVNNRTVHVSRAGATLLAVEQDVPAGRGQTQREPDFVGGPGFSSVRKGNQADLQGRACFEVPSALAGDGIYTEDLGAGPEFDRVRGRFRLHP